MINHLHHACSVATLAVVALLAPLAAADPVALDLSDGLNWDGFISTAELDYAESFNPADHWGLPNRRVDTIFTQNITMGGTATVNMREAFAFQNQTTSTNTGLPDSGAITQGAWGYQLVMDLDAEPDGGYPVFAEGTAENPGTDPRGQAGVDVAQNVILITERDNEGLPQSATVNLPLAQQGQYANINFLLTGGGGSNRSAFEITAIYDDGNQVIWSGVVPKGNDSLDPGVFPDDANFEAAITTTQRFNAVGGGTSARHALSVADRSMWQFVDDGLTLDPTRTLVGLTFTDDSSANGFTTIYAASANVVPEPASGMVVAAMGGVMMLRSRTRRTH